MTRKDNPMLAPWWIVTSGRDAKTTARSALILRPHREDQPPPCRQKYRRLRRVGFAIAPGGRDPPARAVQRSFSRFFAFLADRIFSSRFRGESPIRKTHRAQQQSPQRREKILRAVFFDELCGLALQSVERLGLAEIGFARVG